MFASSRIAHAVGGRRRPPPLGIAGRAPDDRRCSARRARAWPRRDPRRSGGRCRRSPPAARPGRWRWHCGGRQPPEPRATAPESPCDTCGCRRRWRSRAPSSSRSERPATASARRQSAPTPRRPRASRSRGVATPCRRFIRSRPTRSATSPFRSRRYGSATSSNTALNSSNTCWRAHSALTCCWRTRSAARGISIGSSSIRICASNSDASSGPRRRSSRLPMAVSCSRASTRGPLEAAELLLEPLLRDPIAQHLGALARGPPPAPTRCPERRRYRSGAAYVLAKSTFDERHQRIHGRALVRAVG